MRPAILDTVASMAGLLATGEVDGEQEQATGLLGLVLRHTATWFETRERAEPLLNAPSEQLPGPVFDAARAHGERLELTNIAPLNRQTLM